MYTGPDLFVMVMLTNEGVMYEDGNPAIDDFEVFTSVEKAKQYALAMEEQEWADLDDRPAQFVPPTWTDSDSGTHSRSSDDRDMSYLGYQYVIGPILVDPHQQSQEGTTL